MLISCGPSRYAVHVEMLHPSKSGLDLNGKIISTVYYSGSDPVRNQLSENMALGFAKALEEDYATGKGSVGVYSVDESFGDYSVRDSLVNLVVRTSGDVVFLMDIDMSGSETPQGMPVKVSLYCYDGMNKADVVRKFTGSSVIPSSSQAEMISEASKAGSRVAESFKPQWLHEQYSLAYYDSTPWYEAIARAEQYDWRGAMDIWFTLLDTSDMLKRASAEYNLAVACYMLGDIDLASCWLDKSVKDNDMPTLTKALRTRIDARKATR